MHIYIIYLYTFSSFSLYFEKFLYKRSVVINLNVNRVRVYITSPAYFRLFPTISDLYCLIILLVCVLLDTYNLSHSFIY